MTALVLKGLETKPIEGQLLRLRRFPGAVGQMPTSRTSVAITQSGLAICTKSPPRSKRWAIASAARRALDYLFNVQQKTTAVSRRTPGRWPPIGGALQLDEVALPLSSLISWAEPTAAVG